MQGILPDKITVNHTTRQITLTSFIEFCYSTYLCISNLLIHNNYNFLKLTVLLPSMLVRSLVKIECNTFVLVSTNSNWCQ